VTAINAAQNKGFIQHLPESLATCIFSDMKLFDSHCHLSDGALFSGIENMMERASAAGVERMACCGTSPNDWQKVLQLAEQFPQVTPMIGIHPWFVSRAGAVTPPDSEVTDLGYKWKQNIQALGKLLREHPEAGVGETGLDSQTRFANRAEQEASFAAHLDLARELNRPVAVHCVQAWGRLIEILRQHPAPRVLLHAFGGAAELIPELVDLNCWFSFCGSVANPNAKRIRSAAVAVPANRLLIETDSPDFTPPVCQPPNEPANLVQVAKIVAELRGISPESLAELTFSNTERFFASV
jgi:TatD DNase family protein